MESVTDTAGVEIGVLVVGPEMFSGSDAVAGIEAGALAGTLAIGSYLLYQQSCSKAVYINALRSNAPCSAKRKKAVCQYSCWLVSSD